MIILFERFQILLMFIISSINIKLSSHHHQPYPLFYQLHVLELCCRQYRLLTGDSIIDRDILAIRYEGINQTFYHILASTFISALSTTSISVS